MGSRTSWRLFSIRGIPVRVDFSWVFAAIYLTLIFTSQFSRVAQAAEVSDRALLLPPIAWGLLLMLLLFACVLLHELAHVWVARAGGTPVRAITLMMLGGVSEMEPIERPAHERWVSLAGPALSLVLGGLFWWLFRSSGAGPADLRFGLFYLAQVNLVVGVFNLVPAFPMDGGRVLRSLLVPRLGRVGATQVAAAVGKIVAALMVVTGIVAGSFWLVLIAVFIALAGEAEARALAARAALEGLRVRDLFTRQLVVVDANETLGRAAAAMLEAKSQVAVVAEGNRAVGIVSANEISRAPARQRDRVAVGQVMRKAPVVSIDEELPTALRLLDEGLDAVPVADAGQVVGILSREEVARAAQLRQLVAVKT
jgi:Zn-dependent protease/predicted transcriptional regulator